MKRFEFDHEDRKHLIAEGLCCPVCGGEIYPRGTVEYDMVQYLRFDCPGAGHHPVLRVDTIDGHIKLHFYALPEDVTFGWYHEPIEEPEPAPAPIMLEPEPAYARESEAYLREKQLREERIHNAHEAHAKIAQLVLSKQRQGLSFIDRSTVLARLMTLRKQKVWAVDANHPAITQIINDHGGKIVLGRMWEKWQFIVPSHSPKNGKELASQRTSKVRLGSETRVSCYLFSAKHLEDHRKYKLATGSLF